eukprot:COSAG02_NODE_7940_length_2777_cov_2.516804_3_plen_132_part_01
MYAPTNATTNAVGGGATVTIITDYPFSDTVKVQVMSKHPFPLHLRIPSWVDGATISVDGRLPLRATTTGAFHTVDKVGGPSGSIVVLTMRNSIRVEEGGYNKLCSLCTRPPSSLRSAWRSYRPYRYEIVIGM